MNKIKWNKEKKAVWSERVRKIEKKSGNFEAKPDSY